jgi:hypothetical protein
MQCSRGSCLFSLYSLRNIIHTTMHFFFLFCQNLRRFCFSLFSSFLLSDKLAHPMHFFTFSLFTFQFLSGISIPSFPQTFPPHPSSRLILCFNLVFKICPPSLGFFYGGAIFSFFFHFLSHTYHLSSASFISIQAGASLLCFFPAHSSMPPYFCSFNSRSPSVFFLTLKSIHQVLSFFFYFNVHTFCVR